MTDFSLHPQLEADCHWVGRLENCQILLHHNAGVPWYIVVPETEAGELHEMGMAERADVDWVTDTMARFIKHHHASERINLGAIGNRVPQLHIHVIGRSEGDPCWPDAVWGHLPAGPAWSEAAIEAIRQQAPVEP